mgnify:CR=1 FL=1
MLKALVDQWEIRDEVAGDRIGPARDRRLAVREEDRRCVPRLALARLDALSQRRKLRAHQDRIHDELFGLRANR